MTTASEIVTRAFRHLGVAATGETLPAEEINEGIDALNAMMHGWKLDGVDVEHTTLAASDTFALGPEYEEGTAYVLAGRLSHDYETPPSFDADDWFRKIQAAYTVIDDVDIPVTSGLTKTPSQIRYGTLS